MIEGSRLLEPYIAGKRSINLRDLSKFKVDDPDAFKRAMADANIDPHKPGEETGGFYYPADQTIHLPRTAHFGEAMHEAIHKYSKLMLALCTDLNEGITQYIADAVLEEQGLPKAKRVAYEEEVACATKFIHEFGFDAVAKMYFWATTTGMPAGARNRVMQGLAKCGRAPPREKRYCSV